MQLIRALAAAVMLWVAGPAPASERSIFQYTHLRWTDETDSPRPAVALAEDHRGYLFVAGTPGLFAYDGSGFIPLSSHVDLVREGAPSALLVRRNGDVWTNFERSHRFAIFRNGWLFFPKVPPAPHRVSAMQEARDGTVWVLTEQIGKPLMRYRNGRWTTFGVEAGAPIDNPFSMVVTRDGAVWLSFTGSVMRLAPDSGRLKIVRVMPRSLGRLSIDGDDRIWISERGGTYPLTGPGGRGNPPPLRFAYPTDDAEIRGWPRFDRDGNLWIATYYDGLQRIAKPDPRGAASAVEAAARVERFTKRDGLSSNATSQIFPDSEGNVWATTEGGLDRFRPATVRFEPELTDPAAFGDLLLEASDGSVYIGQAGTVYRVRPGKDPEAIFRTKIEPRTLCEAPDGSIWIGVRKDVLVWRDGKIVRKLPSVPLEFTIYDCAFDADGAYWVTAARGGMARFERSWKVIARQSADFEPKSMVADERGRLAVHWSERTIRRLNGRLRSSATIPLGDYAPNDVMLYPGGNGELFVAGRFGLARLQGGRFQSLSARRFPWLSSVSGMVRTDRGETWLAGASGLVRVSSEAFDGAFADPRRQLSPRIFGPTDGLGSLPHSHSRRSIVQGGDGRIWIATQTGTLWLDPSDIRRRPDPPRAWIHMLTADKLYFNPARLTLPAGTDRMTIHFGVFHFSNPRGARVRYRLDGQDTDWIEAATLRNASYRYLGPGTYRFRLRAANEDGVWTAGEKTVDIVIPPTFLQSWWFFALCAAIVLGLLWLAYRYRVAQLAARIRTGMEERIAERERIARELHDTLLQSVQGLVLKFQSVANKMPEGGPLRGRLDDALRRADDVMAEGRRRVHDLRPPEAAGDLAALLQARAREIDLDPPIPIRIVVEGRPRAIHPLVSVEIGRIANEALNNIVRHAEATAIEISVRYTARELIVEIADDGVGIAPDVLKDGLRPGHFGLVGMRERAEKIGGILALHGQPGAGSVVSVRLPARFAYVDHVSRTGRLRKLFRR